MPSLIRLSNGMWIVFGVSYAVLSFSVGRTITFRCLAGALSSMAGMVRVRSAKHMPRRNHSFSPLRVVHVTSKRVAPTLAKLSRIACASLCPVLAVLAPSSAMAPPGCSVWDVGGEFTVVQDNGFSPVFNLVQQAPKAQLFKAATSKAQIFTS
jgi:hypothetical protein